MAYNKLTLTQRIGKGLLIGGGILAVGGWCSAIALKDHAESGLTEDARYVMAVEEDPAAQEDNRIRARYEQLRILPEVQATISEYKEDVNIAFPLLIIGCVGGCMIVPGAPMYTSSGRRKEWGQ